MESDPEVVLVDKVDEDELSTDKDSGMESAANSKDDTPERKSATLEDLPKEDEPEPVPVKPVAASKPPTSQQAVVEKRSTDCDNYDDEPDETLSERLWGLTEMFPDGVRNFTGAVTNLSLTSVKVLYKFTCNASWIFFTSSMILFAPVVFEAERAQVEEMQKTQQKQVLLGPGSAVGAGGGGIAAMPPMAAR
ncbi:mitochondrial import receptor subunit TOM22 homolog [Uranotaenia lowii]|uniref:mitochondrial import receptor subunit TOM22 homolog n=1 Tax=Uranotaenia lowii TaxID=190385 RepID=UPI0024796FF1|nr:mitochondrial import receptor subunit TOM22 homolog [Uranotaenia lowii]